MKDFRMREITEESKDGTIQVTRTRTSNNFASISIKIDGSIKFIFTNENETEDNAGTYEERVLELIQLLNKIADNSCALPVIE